MDREMMKALIADAEKLNQLAGGDHTPEFLDDCEACGGSGEILETIHVYEAGCGFSHPDVAGKPCKVCNGVGFFILEVEGKPV